MKQTTNSNRGLLIASLTAGTLLLGACGTILTDSSAVCDGARASLDEHAVAIVENSDQIPTEVLVTGSNLVAVMEAGCQYK